MSLFQRFACCKFVLFLCVYICQLQAAFISLLCLPGITQYLYRKFENESMYIKKLRQDYYNVGIRRYMIG